MEHHVSTITRIVNQYLGPYAMMLLNWLHIQPRHADEPIPQHVVMAMLVVVIATITALILRARLSVERPGPLQQIAELLIINPMGFGIRDLLEENVGHDGGRYVAFVGSIAIFILVANLFG